MPSRILREGILASDRVEQLDWPAEVFYRRLMSKVDDHGLYDARPSMLRASLYPLRIDRVREADCVRWLAACEKAGLIVLYEAEGKPYLRMLDTKWQLRADPKYPLPPDINGEQPLTVAPVVGVVVGDEGEGGSARARTTPASKRSPKTAMPENFGISDRVRMWAVEKGHDRLDQHLESFCRKVRKHGYRYVDWDDALMEAIRENWAKLPAVAGANGKPWFLTWSAIEAKGKELGIVARNDEAAPTYRARVYKAAGVTPEQVKRAEADYR